MDNLNDQLVPPIQKDSSEMLPRSFHRFKIVLLAIILLMAVLTATYVIKIKKNQSASSDQDKNMAQVPSPKTTTYSNSNQASIYKSNFWGFQLHYPKNWFIWEGKSGTTVFIASFDGKDKDTWYIPNKQELLIKIFIQPEDRGSNFVWTDPDHIVSQSKGPLIDGEDSKEVYEKTPLSNAEKDILKRYEIPLSQTPQERYTLEYITGHNNFTYAISAEPADSSLVNEFKNIFTSIKFIPRIEYKARSNSPTTGTKYYQDIRLGFTFDYPENLVFNPPDTGIGDFKNTNIIVNLADSIYADTRNFEKDIISYASTICSSDGWMSDGRSVSIGCPEENIQLEPFTSRYDIQGYKIKREMVSTISQQNGKQTKEKTEGILIAYKLNAPDYFGVFFYSTLPENEEKMIEIANSFRYLELKNE